MVAGDMQGFPKRNEIIAYVVAVLPFVISFTSITTVNGRVTSYADFADVILGGILLVIALRNSIFIREGEPKYKIIRIVLMIVLILLALFHIAGGLGFLVSLPPPLGFGA
ncbi:MAG: hypothetical protein IAE89_06500 [Anaerolineae bacterium]|nr:hypothetical protein [Anaerolineae bacterium]